jgi:hypothetical protein
VLGNDISQATSASYCLQVLSVGVVQLDCRGHAVAGLNISTVNTVAVANCSVTGTLNVQNATNVTVTNCTLAAVQISNASSVVVASSAISATRQPVSVSNGTNVALVQNTINSAPGAGINAEAVLLINGTNNQVVQDTFTGGYDGGGTEDGTDDAVVLSNETGDTIKGNTISAFFDTAVEGLGLVANTTVANNTISSIGTAALGAYYCTNWTGNVIQGNQVSLAPSLLLVNEEGGAFCTTPPPVFSGNQFVGNQFRNPIGGVFGTGPRSPRMVVIFVPGTAAGNLIQNNDFGTNDGPLVEPLSAFVDGGGNICGPQNPALSNFACTGGAPSAHVSGDAHVLFRPPHPVPPSAQLARISRHDR